MHVTKNYRQQIFIAILLIMGGASSVCSAHNKRFAIIIPSRNNSEWCDRNLSALADQEYDNWYAIYLNDASTDDTKEKVERFIKRHGLEDKIFLINNATREGAMGNIYKAVHMCKDDDIIVTYDGDDFLNGPHVLSRLNEAYADENVWLTYGSYQHYPNIDGVNPITSSIPDDVVLTNSYRRDFWRVSHLRTFYAWLFKHIKEEDLKVDGEFLPMAWDFAMMYPMLEMAGGRFKYIPEVLYIYNVATPNNDYKVNRDLQLKLVGIITSRPAYQPLTGILGSRSTEHWDDMQYLYKELCRNIASKNGLRTNDPACHPHWQRLRTHIEEIVLGPYNPSFLDDADIQYNMVRSGMSVAGSYELCYLLNCLSDKANKLRDKFTDTSFGNIPLVHPEFLCSANSLGHLFYAIRTAECMHKEPGVIIEFGGGYGNLARIYKKIFPNCTYIIIDLPELLALQYFFLAEALPDNKVVLHTESPISYTRGGVHLMSVDFLEQMNLPADLFISTFALSEASEKAQNIVKSKHFFNAELVYIVGQLNGWGSGLNFVHQGVIHDGVRSCYEDVDCHPYHLYLENLKSYELIARHPKFSRALIK